MPRKLILCTLFIGAAAVVAASAPATTAGTDANKSSRTGFEGRILMARGAGLSPQARSRREKSPGVVHTWLDVAVPSGITNAGVNGCSRRGLCVTETSIRLLAPEEEAGPARVTAPARGTSAIAAAKVVIPSIDAVEETPPGESEAAGAPRTPSALLE